jgi:hypothetical protein
VRSKIFVIFHPTCPRREARRVKNFLIFFFAPPSEGGWGSIFSYLFFSFSTQLIYIIPLLCRKEIHLLRTAYLLCRVILGIISLRTKISFYRYPVFLPCAMPTSVGCLRKRHYRPFFEESRSIGALHAPTK